MFPMSLPCYSSPHFTKSMQIGLEKSLNKIYKVYTQRLQWSLGATFGNFASSLISSHYYLKMNRAKKLSSTQLQTFFGSLNLISDYATSNKTETALSRKLTN